MTDKIINRPRKKVSLLKQNKVSMHKTEHLSQSLLASIDKTHHSANKTGIPSDFELEHLITTAQHIVSIFLV